jgi:hypothetical protein
MSGSLSIVNSSQNITNGNLAVVNGTITSAQGGFTGSLFGTSSASEKINVNNTTVGAGDFYPVFVSEISGSQISRVDSTGFTFTPNSNLLTVTASRAISSSVSDTSVSSSYALSASYALSSSRAVTASSADTVRVTELGINDLTASFQIPMVREVSGSQNLLASTVYLDFTPSSNTLFVTSSFAAAAISASNGATASSADYINIRTGLGLTGSLRVSGALSLTGLTPLNVSHVKANDVQGVEILTNSGTTVATFGAGGGTGVTVVGQVNATSFSGSGALISGVVSSSYSVSASYALTASFLAGFQAQAITSGSVSASATPNPNIGLVVNANINANSFSNLNLITGSRSTQTNYNTMLIGPISLSGSTAVFNIVTGSYLKII